MRVLIVSHGYGIPEWFRLLEVTAETHDVTLLAPDSFETTVFGELQPPDRASKATIMATRTFPLNRLSAKAGGHFLFRPSWRELRSFRPDLIQIEYEPWRPEFWSVILPLTLLRPRTPVLLLVKKNTRHVAWGPIGWLERALTWLGMKRVTRVLAVSQKAGDVLAQLGYGHKPVTLQGHIPLSSALEEAVPDRSDHDTFQVGYVGGLTVKKGIAELIEAVGITRDRTGRDIQLRLVGPPGEASLVALVNRLPWVHAPGPIPNHAVPAFLATLDAFAMPSRVLRDHEEHDGHALLEAMAAGLPCLASSSGIIPELIEHETSGLLHTPRDVETLADQVERLVTDRDLRERLGHAARKSALDRAGLRSLAQQRLQTYAEVACA